MAEPSEGEHTTEKNRLEPHESKWIILQDTVRDRRAEVDTMSSALARENAIVLALTILLAVVPLPRPASATFTRDTKIGAVFMMVALGTSAFWFAIRHVPADT